MNDISNFWKSFVKRQIWKPYRTPNVSLVKRSNERNRTIRELNTDRNRIRNPYN